MRISRLVLGLVASVALTSGPVKAGRPNVLWLVAEDLGTELGCYGTAQVWTPNLDRLGGGAVHPRLHDRAGLLGEPVGVHDRHVSDHNRRPQPPLAP